MQQKKVDPILLVKFHLLNIDTLLKSNENVDLLKKAISMCTEVKNVCEVFMGEIQKDSSNFSINLGEYISNSLVKSACADALLSCFSFIMGSDLNSLPNNVALEVCESIISFSLISMTLINNEFIQDLVLMMSNSMRKMPKGMIPRMIAIINDFLFPFYSQFVICHYEKTANLAISTCMVRSILADVFEVCFNDIKLCMDVFENIFIWYSGDIRLVLLHLAIKGNSNIRNMAYKLLLYYFVSLHTTDVVREPDTRTCQSTGCKSDESVGCNHICLDVVVSVIRNGTPPPLLLCSRCCEDLESNILVIRRPTLLAQRETTGISLQDQNAQVIKCYSLSCANRAEFLCRSNDMRRSMDSIKSFSCNFGYHYYCASCHDSSVHTSQCYYLFTDVPTFTLYKDNNSTMCHLISDAFVVAVKQLEIEVEKCKHPLDENTESDQIPQNVVSSNIPINNKLIMHFNTVKNAIILLQNSIFLQKFNYAESTELNVGDIIKFDMQEHTPTVDSSAVKSDNVWDFIQSCVGVDIWMTKIKDSMLDLIKILHIFESYATLSEIIKPVLSGVILWMRSLLSNCPECLTEILSPPIVTSNLSDCDLPIFDTSSLNAYGKQILLMFNRISYFLNRNLMSGSIWNTVIEKWLRFWITYLHKVKKLLPALHHEKLQEICCELREIFQVALHLNSSQNPGSFSEVIVFNFLFKYFDCESELDIAMIKKEYFYILSIIRLLVVAKVEIPFDFFFSVCQCLIRVIHIEPEYFKPRPRKGFILQFESDIDGHCDRKICELELMKDYYPCVFCVKSVGRDAKTELNSKNCCQSNIILQFTDLEDHTTLEFIFLHLIDLICQKIRLVLASDETNHSTKYLLNLSHLMYLLNFGLQTFINTSIIHFNNAKCLFTKSATYSYNMVHICLFMIDMISEKKQQHLTTVQSSHCKLLLSYGFLETFRVTLLLDLNVIYFHRHLATNPELRIVLLLARVLNFISSDIDHKLEECSSLVMKCLENILITKKCLDFSLELNSRYEMSITSNVNKYGKPIVGPNEFFDMFCENIVLPIWLSITFDNSSASTNALSFFFSLLQKPWGLESFLLLLARQFTMFERKNETFEVKAKVINPKNIIPDIEIEEDLSNTLRGTSVKLVERLTTFLVVLSNSPDSVNIPSIVASVVVSLLCLISMQNSEFSEVATSSTWFFKDYRQMELNFMMQCIVAHFEKVPDDRLLLLALSVALVKNNISFHSLANLMKLLNLSVDNSSSSSSLNQSNNKVDSQQNTETENLPKSTSTEASHILTISKLPFLRNICAFSLMIDQDTEESRKKVFQSIFSTEKHLRDIHRKSKQTKIPHLDSPDKLAWNSHSIFMFICDLIFLTLPHHEKELSTSQTNMLMDKMLIICSSLSEISHFASPLLHYSASRYFVISSIYTFMDKYRNISIDFVPYILTILRDMCMQKVKKTDDNSTADLSSFVESSIKPEFEEDYSISVLPESHRKIWLDVLILLFYKYYLIPYQEPISNLVQLVIQFLDGYIHICEYPPVILESESKESEKETVSNVVIVDIPPSSESQPDSCGIGNEFLDILDETSKDIDNNDPESLMDNETSRVNVLSAKRRAFTNRRQLNQTKSSVDHLTKHFKPLEVRHIVGNSRCPNCQVHLHQSDMTSIELAILALLEYSVHQLKLAAPDLPKVLKLFYKFVVYDPFFLPYKPSVKAVEATACSSRNGFSKSSSDPPASRMGPVSSTINCITPTSLSCTALLSIHNLLKCLNNFGFCIEFLRINFAEESLFFKTVVLAMVSHSGTTDSCDLFLLSCLSSVLEIINSLELIELLHIVKNLTFLIIAVIDVTRPTKKHVEGVMATRFRIISLGILHAESEKKPENENGEEVKFIEHITDSLINLMNILGDKVIKNVMDNSIFIKFVSSMFVLLDRTVNLQGNALKTLKKVFSKPDFFCVLDSVNLAYSWFVGFPSNISQTSDSEPFVFFRSYLFYSISTLPLVIAKSDEHGNVAIQRVTLALRSLDRSSYFKKLLHLDFIDRVEFYVEPIGSKCFLDIFSKMPFEIIESFRNLTPTYWNKRLNMAFTFSTLKMLFSEFLAFLVSRIDMKSRASYFEQILSSKNSKKWNVFNGKQSQVNDALHILNQTSWIMLGSLAQFLTDYQVFENRLPFSHTELNVIFSKISSVYRFCLSSPKNFKMTLLRGFMLHLQIATLYVIHVVKPHSIYENRMVNSRNEFSISFFWLDVVIELQEFCKNPSFGNFDHQCVKTFFQTILETLYSLANNNSMHLDHFIDLIEPLRIQINVTIFAKREFISDKDSNFNEIIANQITELGSRLLEIEMTGCV